MRLFFIACMSLKATAWCWQPARLRFGALSIVKAVFICSAIIFLYGWWLLLRLLSPLCLQWQWAAPWRSGWPAASSTHAAITQWYSSRLSSQLPFVLCVRQWVCWLISFIILTIRDSMSSTSCAVGSVWYVITYRLPISHKCSLFNLLCDLSYDDFSLIT